MKKKKPLLILLTFFLILFIGALLLFGKKTSEDGQNESALRRFFSFGNRTSQEGTGNESGGDLLNGGVNPLTGREYTDEELRLLRQDQERVDRERSTTFTGQQPINPFDPNIQGGGFTGTGDFGDTTEGRRTVTTVTTRPPVPNGPACSDIDLYISFTDEEKEQIAKLQQRFNAIATNLVSDQDAQDEENNYSNFKLKTERFKELTAMCEDTMTKASSNPYSALRVATPFWKDARAKLSFIADSIQVRYGTTQIFGNVNINYDDKKLTYTLPLIDTVFKQVDIVGGIPYNWLEILYRIYIW